MSMNTIETAAQGPSPGTISEHWRSCFAGEDRAGSDNSSALTAITAKSDTANDPTGSASTTTGRAFVARNEKNMLVLRPWAFGADGDTFTANIYRWRWNDSRDQWQATLVTELTLTLGTVEVGGISEQAGVTPKYASFASSAASERALTGIGLDLVQPAADDNAPVEIIFDLLGTPVVEIEMTNAGSTTRCNFDYHSF
jgi:hypothetical protein